VKKNNAQEASCLHKEIKTSDMESKYMIGIYIYIYIYILLNFFWGFVLTIFVL